MKTVTNLVHGIERLLDLLPESLVLRAIEDSAADEHADPYAYHQDAA